MSAPTAAVPASCCGREGGCICAAEAKCSCGKQAAMHCNCEKAHTENKIDGARCSCNMRAAGECTCSRASTENSKPSGSTCACGKRSACEYTKISEWLCVEADIGTASCNCSGTEAGASSELETDFTTKP
ncbi:hypothetical protein BDZ85DRAFT_257714 [Elsinoe ampelina]|uniref:DUF7871 domain-containing protein n=1 Tax=Elsinoe ampelina TaxID=302913 RepID=A0A6A6GJB5_9PEZI|nr:hypothetical protein BDZ85DRAFT_257714 [Elsinoe ampelina]